MAIQLETDRLIIRDWIPSQDAEQALQIYSDPDVTRFLSSGKVDKTVEEVRSRLQLYTSFSNGGGGWAVIEKSTGQAIGSIFLIQLPDENGQRILDYEIGWHVCQNSWGKGYATEAARAVIAYGFNILKLPVIYAVVNLENDASIRVTQRLGMTPLGRTNQYYGAETELFEKVNLAENAEFERSRQPFQQEESSD